MGPVKVGADAQRWSSCASLRWLNGVLVGLGCLVWSGTATASPSPLGAVAEYTIPANGVNTVPTPGSIATGPDGNLWFAEGGTATTQGPMGSGVGTVNPYTHAVGEFPISPPPGWGASDISSLTAGPGPDLWFTNNDGVGSFNPFTHATSEYQLTTTPNTYTGPTPESIARGPDGNVWFTGNNNVGGWVGMFSLSSHSFALFPVPAIPGKPHPVAGPIVAGPGGRMWFIDLGKVGAVGTISTSTHVITQYPLAASGASLNGAFGIAKGPDGNIWFTTRHAIGMIRPANHAISLYPIPATGGNTHPRPGQIAPGPGGEMWFIDHGTVTSAGIIDPVTHTITEQPIPGTVIYPTFIASGPDGNMWFSAQGKFPGVGGVMGMIAVTRTRPQLSRLHIRIRRSVLGGRRAASFTVSYRLTRPAGVKVTIARIEPGRIVDGRCVAPTRANGSHRACSRGGAGLASVSTISGAGPTSFAVAGRISRSLAPGRYVLTAVALGGGGTGKTRTVRFLIAS